MSVTPKEFAEASTEARDLLASGQMNIPEMAAVLAENTLARVVTEIVGGMPSEDAIRMGLVASALCMAQVLGHDVPAEIERDERKVRA